MFRPLSIHLQGKIFVPRLINILKTAPSAQYSYIAKVTSLGPFKGHHQTYIPEYRKKTVLSSI